MAFMRPEIRSGSYLIGLGVSPEDLGISPVPGKWYGRLSAPGFIDSTEWAEFETFGEALRGICDTFGLCETCYEDEETCACEQAETDDD